MTILLTASQKPGLPELVVQRGHAGSVYTVPTCAAARARW